MFSKFVAVVAVIIMLAGSLLSAQDKGLSDPHFLDALYAQLVERAQTDPARIGKQVMVLLKGMKIVPEEESFELYHAVRYVAGKFSPASDQMTFIVVADNESYSGARLGDVVFLKSRVVESFVQRHEMSETEFAGVVAHEMGHSSNDALLKYYIMTAKLPQAYKDAMLCRVEAEADARSLVFLKNAGYNLKQAMSLQKNGRYWEPGHIAALHEAIVQEAYDKLMGVLTTSTTSSGK